MVVPSQGHSARYANSRLNASGTLQARLHNYVKHALIQQLVPPGSTVCDLYCGPGVDTEKWARAQIGRYIGIDSGPSILEEAEEQWNNHKRPFCAEFFELDPSSANLEQELRYMGLPVDAVTCMGHLQDCFLKEEIVRSLLQNVVSILKPGGFFFGITADSSTIWSKFQKAVEQAHRAGLVRVLPRVHSEHYIISFEDDRFMPFGTKYTLQFTDGVIFESQQLIHFPSLIRLAAGVGLEYIELQNLQEFYDDYRLQFPDILRATCANLVDPKGRLPQFAHDILSLYTTFIFKKADYLDPNYMLSPFPPSDEEPMEISCEDMGNGNKASLHEHLSALEEVNMGLKTLPVSTLHEVEYKEASVLKPEEDQRVHLPTMIQVDGSIHQSPLVDTSKESAQDMKSSCGDSKHSDVEGEEVKLDVQAAVESELLGRDIEDIQPFDKGLEFDDTIMTQSPGFNSKGCGLGGHDEVHHKELEPTEKRIHSESTPKSSPLLPVMNTRSPLGGNKQQHLKVSDEASLAQVLFSDGDMVTREASINVAIMEEVREEIEEQSIPKREAIEDMLSKPFAVHTPVVSKKRKLERRDGTPPEDTPPLVGVKDKSSTEPDVREQKANEGHQPEKMKEVSKQHAAESLVPSDVQNAVLHNRELDTNGDKPSMTDLEKNGDRSSSKQSLGRLNTSLREESVHKRLQSGLTSGQPRYRSGRPYNHHHVPFSEERQEQSHGPRHGSHSSYGLKGSRDRVGDHRSEHLSPIQRGDSHRGRSRSAHLSPTFVPFSHFVPQTEFPIFHSPNTPGILGPGPPPVLVIEPICPLWPIPPPLERRLFPKSRTPRKSGSEREGGRARRDSPKRHWKDSPPPPGTES